MSYIWEPAITPKGYESYNAHRDARKGGGVAIICRNELQCKVKEFDRDFPSFECMQLDVRGNNKCYSLYPLYRPEPNNETISKFLEEFSTLLEEISVVPQDIVILGDFNIHIDVDNSTSAKFNDIITAFDLVQHVLEPTHESGHILDLVISKPNDFVSGVQLGEYFSDHKAITFNIKSQKLPSRKQLVKSRNYRNMDTNAFISDITRFLSNIQPSTSICELVKLVALYENVLVDLIDKYAPIKTRLVINRPKAPWMNEEILKEKKIKRKCERKWRATKLPQDKEIFKVQKKKYDRLLRDAHTRYLSSLVIDNAKDPKSLFKIINEFLNGKKEKQISRAYI